MSLRLSFFFNDPSTTEIYTLSLHDALPILTVTKIFTPVSLRTRAGGKALHSAGGPSQVRKPPASLRLAPRADRRRSRAGWTARDRKSTRLNSSHLVISYAVFCLKNK